MEANEDDLKSRDVINSVISTFKPIYKGLILYNEGYDKSKGNQILATANADLVSFARPFIANPYLPQRLAMNAHFNTPDFAKVYGRGEQDLEQGYTYYSFLGFPEI